MKHILVTGVSGFLGRYVALSLRLRYHVLGTYHEHATALEACEVSRLDVADGEAVRATVQSFRPDVIVHTAAMGDVDACERHPDAAYRVNVQGTESIAQATMEVGARLIYISTDQVYDGLRGDYAEEDVPQPLMVYGQTKLAGERRAATICGDAVILRLALMYGWGDATRLNFVDVLAERLRAGHEVPVFVDQYRTPLYVAQAAEGIERLINTPQVRGVLNLGGGERVSRYAFGVKFCDVFHLPQGLLKPVTMPITAQMAARPRDCSLNSAKINTLLQLTPLAVVEGLQAMRRQRAT